VVVLPVVVVTKELAVVVLVVIGILFLAKHLVVGLLLSHHYQ
jgi:hypothetical protein